MNTITIVGLGPGRIDDMTVAAYRALFETEGKKFFRTLKHPVAEAAVEAGIALTSFDNFYEELESLAEVEEKIYQILREEGQKQENLFYFVLGHPIFGENVVKMLTSSGLRDKIRIEFLGGISQIDAAMTVIAEDFSEGCQIIEASQFDSRMIDFQQGILITNIDDEGLLSELGVQLTESYGDEQEVLVIDHPMDPSEKVQGLPLMNLYQVKCSHLTSVYVPRVVDQTRFGFRDLIAIIERLRSPGGCPWDREQTHESLRANLLEETYEVIEAINQQDDTNLEEELGDVLLQIVFHGLIAEEDGFFTLLDITTGICEKMIRRHPHVFAGESIHTTDGVLKRWEEIKADEKSQRVQSQRMKELPEALPMLVRSRKVQKKAAEIGFDWPDAQGPMQKLQEELEEFQEALRLNQTDEMEMEFGDLLFAIVNVSRFYKIHPELALKRATDKFIRRFSWMENEAEKRGLEMETLGLEALDSLWDECKQEE
jgi:tetrapyrrole methylase family protein/MazG family protein